MIGTIGLVFGSPTRRKVSHALMLSFDEAGQPTFNFPIQLSGQEKISVVTRYSSPSPPRWIAGFPMDFSAILSLYEREKEEL